MRSIRRRGTVKLLNCMLHVLLQAKYSWYFVIIVSLSLAWRGSSVATAQLMIYLHFITIIWLYATA